MVDLTVIKGTFLRHQGRSRTIHNIILPAFRGMITDRNDEPLAVSTPVESVWVNPKDFKADSKQLYMLAKILNIPTNQLQTRLRRYKNKSFVYLKRDLEPVSANKIKSLKIAGLYLQREYKRFYPEGEVASQLVGFTNVDDHGQEGLELAYDQWLSGTPGKEIVKEDLMGHLVGDIQEVKKQEPGKDLALSIDQRIQYIAYQTLKNTVKQYHAKAGSIVVLNIKTGEVLAMVNQPSFNPNNREHISIDSIRNRAETDMFEPGSTMKAFSVASALASGKYTPDTIVDTSPGWWRVGHHWVRDEINNGVLNVTQILQKSSNVGISKMTLSLPPEHLISVLNAMGFGYRTDSGFPGEASGHIVDPQQWKPFVLATLTFGYGISVTTLQLAHAYSVLANHGQSVPVTLLKRDQTPIATQVFDPKVADEMLPMLESVLQFGGTGRRARVKGYRVAGKTGTAKIAGNGGYFADRYISSFVGVAPVSDPELVVAVVVFEPEGKAYYGGLVAAPAFSKVMGSALRILDIAPDNA